MALLLVSVIVSTEGAPVATVVGENTLLINGNGKFSVLLVAAILAPAAVVNPPAGIVFT